MHTIEPRCAIVDIVAWPEEEPWEGRYRTASSIDRGVCRLVLSPEVFHDPAKANTAYRRFAGKMEREGFVPPTVEFTPLSSRASRRMFCILTPRGAVFNTACPVQKNMVVLDAGRDATRKVLAILAGDLPQEKAHEPA